MAATDLRADKVVVESKNVNASASVIYLHGGTGSGEASAILAYKTRDALPWVRWIFPNASLKQMPAIDDQPMPTWYRLKTIMPPVYDPGWFEASEEEESESFEDMLQNVNRIKTIILEEIEEKHIPSHRIVLAGFSQGAAQALVTALLMPVRLAGCSSLVGFLPLEQRFRETIEEKLRHFPLLFRVAGRDELLHESWSNNTHRLLQAAEACVVYQKLPGKSHFCETDEDVVRGFVQWLEEVVPAEQTDSKKAL